MKNIILILFCVFTGSNMVAQSLDDFYEKSFEIYSPFTFISSTYKNLDTIGYDKSKKFWGVLNLGGSYSSAKHWGLSGSFNQRLLGDLLYALRGVMSKRKKINEVGDVFYLSDFGLVPNFRLGLNVFAKDNMVINVGINHGYYVTNTAFIQNGNPVYNSNDWISIGPNIYIDRAINDWLAIRLETSPVFSYGNGDKEKENVPKIWEHRIEIFTKSGIFACADFLRFSKFHDDIDNNIRIRRTDLKFGIRIKL